jgi:hypothetical protein
MVILFLSKLQVLLEEAVLMTQIASDMGAWRWWCGAVVWLLGGFPSPVAHLLGCLPL